MVAHSLYIRVDICRWDASGLAVNSSHGHLVTSEHCTKLWMVHAKLCGQGRRGWQSRQWSHSFICSGSSFRTPHDQTPKLSLGAQNSVGMWTLRVTINMQNLGAPWTLRGDSRGKCFSLTPLPSKFSIFFVFCSQQYGQQREKNIRKSLIAFSRKFHLKIAKFPILLFFG